MKFLCGNCGHEFHCVSNDEEPPLCDLCGSSTRVLESSSAGQDWIKETLITMEQTREYS